MEITYLPRARLRCFTRLVRDAPLKDALSFSDRRVIPLSSARQGATCTICVPPLICIYSEQRRVLSSLSAGRTAKKKKDIFLF